MTKICIICNTEYEPTGRCQKYCPSCKESYFLITKRKEIQKKYRNSEQGKKKYILNRERQFEYGMYKGVKARAKKKGIEFTLSLEDIIIPEICPYLKVSLTKESGKGIVWTNASLDRINPLKGYTKDNIEVISYLANTMKNKATKEQLITFASSILERYK